MSAKIYAFTHMVEGYKEKISENLLLPIKEVGRKLYFIEGYQVSLEEDFIVSCLSYTDALPYWSYFDNERNLRVQCFDVIRALGLTEMWVFDENLTDVLGGDSYSLSEALEEMASACSDKICHEFIVDEVNDNDYYSFYHDQFADLFQEVEQLELRFEVKILGLKWEIDSNTGEKLIRVLKNNKVYYMGKESGKLTEISK